MSFRLFMMNLLLEKEKIIEGVTEYPLKNNLIILDKEKIEGLMSKYNRI